MYRINSQWIMVVVMLVAFLGQAMAYSTVLPCEAKDEHVSDSLNNENANHDDADEHVSDCCDIECCDVDCICPSAACSSIVYLSNDVRLRKIMRVTQTLVIEQDIQPDPVSALHYRPPIFTS